MKRLILVAALLVCAVSASAADKWTQVQSKNFTLAGNASEGQIRDVAENLEVFRTAFSKFFPVKNGPSVPTTVIVFKTDDAFKPYKPLYQGKPANIAGYFQQGQDTNYISLAADVDTPRVIYHELIHRLLSDNLSSLPPWFQEGFAECFSSIRILGKDKKVQLGAPLGEHVELLKERSFMPLEKLFAVQHGSAEYNEAEKQGIFYAESWAFVHYMMFNAKDRRAQFMSFLDGISNGTSAPEAFKQAFKSDVATFQKSFEAYIQQRMAWNAFELNTADGLDRNKDFTTRVLSEAESEFFLGDLLLHTRRLPEAETHLTKAVKLDSKLGIAQASMGRLLMQNQKEAEALPYFQRATELAPDNYLTHFYYASLLNGRRGSTGDQDWATMRSELQKAIQLAPHFIEATTMLASANLARNVDMPQTVTMLANAANASPGNEYVLLQLAFALSRTDRSTTARAIVRNLLTKPSLDASVRQSAESLISSLDRAEEIERNNKSMAERAAADRTAALARRPVVEADPVDERLLERVTPPRLDEEERPRFERPAEELPAGTLKIRGTLLQLDCYQGLTLWMFADGKNVKFTTTTPNTLKFTSYNPAVSKQIACGPVPGGGAPAAIVYRPKAGADNLGEPISVDFPEVAVQEVRPLPVVEGASQVKGLLTKLVCTDTATIEVNADGKLLKFASVETSKLTILNGPNPDGTIDCGPIKAPGLSVIVLFYPSKTPDLTGQPVVVYFQK